MGTTGIECSMIEAKKVVIKDFSFKNENLSSEVLKTAIGKGGIWILRQIESKENGKYFTIDFVKMSHEKGWTYYKEINFEMGPYFYDCPISWLDKLTPYSEDGRKWIEKVRKINSLVLVPGIKIVFCKVGYTLDFVLSPKFWRVTREDGRVFKLSKENILDCLA